MISVVVPTISGREESLAQVLDAYEDKLSDTEHEVIVIEDFPTWPDACNQGYSQSRGEILLFGADDLFPVSGFHRKALAWLEEYDELPAPRIWENTLDGDHSNTEDGPDGAITWFTRVPIMRRDQYLRIGRWPSIIYLADIWVSEKGRKIGIETRMVYGFDFLHKRVQIGRVDTPANMDKSWGDLAELRRRM